MKFKWVTIETDLEDDYFIYGFAFGIVVSICVFAAYEFVRLMNL